jgi:hypothetical protein
MESHFADETQTLTVSQAKEVPMSEKRSPQSEKQPPQAQVKARMVSGPSDIMSPEEFQRWMSFAVSPEILTPERLELLKEMSDDLARDPAFLRMIERMLGVYGDDIYRISPTDADLAKGGFGWTDGTGGEVAIAPAAAAAALAPPAASLAAAHAPSE